MPKCTLCGSQKRRHSKEGLQTFLARRFCSHACANTKACSIDTRLKISVAQKGIPKSLAARQAMRGPRKPRTISYCSLCGKAKRQRTTENSNRYRLRRFCSLSCAGKIKNVGRPSPFRGVPRPSMQGSNSPTWRGGLTSLNSVIRASSKYKAWRSHVFKRDNYTCQACGARGAKLHADHELPFALFPALRLEILNGRTLCVPCHRKTPTWGGNASKLYAHS